MMASAVNVSYDLSSSEAEDDDESTSGEVENAFSGKSPVVKSDSESDGNQSDNDVGNTKQGRGMANVMAQILGKKVPKEKRVPILAKGTTDKQITVARKRKEEEGDEETNKTKKKKKIKSEEKGTDSSDEEEIDGNEKKKLWEEMGRLKPSITDKNKERTLQRTATKGVVQLFNAVKKQQKIIDDQLKQVGGSEIKKDKVMKSMTKGKFIDVLKKTNANISAEPVKSSATAKKKQKKKHTDTQEEEENPSWSILRDDFMMGGKMKDWDKEDEDDGKISDDAGKYSDSDS